MPAVESEKKAPRDPTNGVEPVATGDKVDASNGATLQGDSAPFASLRVDEDAGAVTTAGSAQLDRVEVHDSRAFKVAERPMAANQSDSKAALSRKNDKRSKDKHDRNATSNSDERSAGTLGVIDSNVSEIMILKCAEVSSTPGESPLGKETLATNDKVAPSKAGRELSIFVEPSITASKSGTAPKTLGPSLEDAKTVASNGKAAPSKADREHSITANTSGTSPKTLGPSLEDAKSLASNAKPTQGGRETTITADASATAPKTTEASAEDENPLATTSDKAASAVQQPSIKVANSTEAPKTLSANAMGGKTPATIAKTARAVREPSSTADKSGTVRKTPEASAEGDKPLATSAKAASAVHQPSIILFNSKEAPKTLCTTEAGGKTPATSAKDGPFPTVREPSNTADKSATGTAPKTTDAIAEGGKPLATSAKAPSAVQQPSTIVANSTEAPKTLCANARGGKTPAMIAKTAPVVRDLSSTADKSAPASQTIDASAEGEKFLATSAKAASAVQQLSTIFANSTEAPKTLCTNEAGGKSPATSAKTAPAVREPSNTVDKSATAPKTTDASAEGEKPPATTSTKVASADQQPSIKVPESKDAPKTRIANAKGGKHPATSAKDGPSPAVREPLNTADKSATAKKTTDASAEGEKPPATTSAKATSADKQSSINFPESKDAPKTRIANATGGKRPATNAKDGPSPAVRDSSSTADVCFPPLDNTCTAGATPVAQTDQSTATREVGSRAGGSVTLALLNNAFFSAMDDIAVRHLELASLANSVAGTSLSPPDPGMFVAHGFNAPSNVHANADQASYASESVLNIATGGNGIPSIINVRLMAEQVQVNNASAYSANPEANEMAAMEVEAEEQNTPLGLDAMDDVDAVSTAPLDLFANHLDGNSLARPASVIFVAHSFNAENNIDANAVQASHTSTNVHSHTPRQTDVPSINNVPLNEDQSQVDSETANSVNPEANRMRRAEAEAAEQNAETGRDEGGGLGGHAVALYLVLRTADGIVQVTGRIAQEAWRIVQEAWRIIQEAGPAERRIIATIVGLFVSSVLVESAVTPTWTNRIPESIRMTYAETEEVVLFVTTWSSIVVILVLTCPRTVSLLTHIAVSTATGLFTVVRFILGAILVNGGWLLRRTSHQVLPLSMNHVLIAIRIIALGMGFLVIAYVFLAAYFSPSLFEA
jgi:hypothetical protein